jgi:molybdopterin converting factor small subunit
MVRVKLYGGARKLAGREEAELEVEAGARLSDLLRRIAQQPAQIPAGVASAILINGRNCAFRQGLDTPVADGDLVEILPIVTGG